LGFDQIMKVQLANCKIVKLIDEENCENSQHTVTRPMASK